MRHFWAALLALASPAHADTLIDNVDGITIDAQGQVQRFTGLLTDNNGRIQQIFQRGDKRPLRTDFRMDGKGRVLMPGIIDSHVELMKLGFARIPPAGPGARPRPEDRDLALYEAQKMLLERGITAVADMGTTIEDWQTYRRAGDMGTLTLRIMAYAAGTDAMALIGGPGPTPWLYDDRLRLNGVHVVLDGPLETRSAALKTPYADAPKLRGELRLNEIQLKNILSRASIDRFQVAVDAVGDRASATLLTAIEDVALTYKGERRWRMEQAQVVDPIDVPRFGKNGIVVTMGPRPETQRYQTPNPAILSLSKDCLSSGQVRTKPEEKISPSTRSGKSECGSGPARLVGPSAWMALTANGAKWTFGSGGTEPFAAFQTSPLPREAAIAAYTSSAAWAGFAEGRFGRITVGQRADFLLVDGDPLLVKQEDLSKIKVLQTWVGGKMVYQSAPSPS